MKNQNRIPAFESAVDREEWYLQMVLQSRKMRGISDNDLRAFLEIQPYHIESDYRSGIKRPSHRVMVDENNIPAAVNEVLNILSESDIEDGKFEAETFIISPQGQHWQDVLGHRQYSKDIINVIKTSLEKRKQKGHLTPKAVTFNPQILKKYEQRQPA